jgi:hypothetical protein
VSTSITPSFSRVKDAVNASELLRTKMASVKAGLDRNSRIQRGIGEYVELWKSLSVHAYTLGGYASYSVVMA